MSYFRYTIPTYPYFYSQNMWTTSTVFYNEEPVIGDYYVRFSNKETSEAFVIEKSFLDPGQKLLQKILEKDINFKNHLLKICNEVINLADKFEELNYKNLRENTLSDLAEFYSEYKSVLVPAITIGYSLDYAFDKYIKENNIDLHSMKPFGESFLIREKRALQKVFENPDFENLLMDHAKRFSWLKNNYAGENPISISDLLERKNDVLDLTEETPEHKKEPETLEEWISYLTYIRDERKRLNLISIGLMDRWLKQYCIENNITYEVAVFNTAEEILNSGISNLKDYKGLRITHMTKNGPKDISEDEWVKATLVQSDVSTEIKGNVAYKGKVIGKAKIVITKEDFSKVEKGDVIVASMTRPEFMPVMEKCAAIVTDEGGITCHAAIVARELKRPCIIGTRNATKKIEDGDIVEVDADNGIVRIIK